MAAFFLGAWIAGCLFMAAVSILSLRAPNLVMEMPQPAVNQMQKTLGSDNMTLLLRHSASQLSRFLLRRWQQGQVLIGVALGVCLFLGTQRRVFPLLLCGIMLVMVLFQYRVTGELLYRGRETDFPPGSNEIGPTTRYLLLQQVYIGAEIMKLIAASILASFLFVFRTRGRRSKEIHAIDHADHSHVDG
jgi:hypothetical protein